MRPETQEIVHSLVIEADDEESIVAMIMRATLIVNVDELCIVDFVDLKIGKQSKLFSAERGSEHFIDEGIIFDQISSFRVPYVKNQQGLCLMTLQTSYKFSLKERASFSCRSRSCFFSISSSSRLAASSLWLEKTLNVTQKYFNVESFFWRSYNTEPKTRSALHD